MSNEPIHTIDDAIAVLRAAGVKVEPAKEGYWRVTTAHTGAVYADEEVIEMAAHGLDDHEEQP